MAAATDEAAAWSVRAAGHAARWASGDGPRPVLGEEFDPRLCRGLANRYGQIPAGHCHTTAASFGGHLTAAVSDDEAFVQLFAPLFGAGLFGLERTARGPALSTVPAPLAARARREFELIRNRGERPAVGPTSSLFTEGTERSLRAWVGARVARTLGARFASELAVLCRGWRPDWRIPATGERREDGLVCVWLGAFEEQP